MYERISRARVPALFPDLSLSLRCKPSKENYDHFSFFHDSIYQQWKVAGLYVVSGLVVAITAGYIIGRLKMEKHVADFVWKIHRTVEVEEENLTWSGRVARAWENSINRRSHHLIYECS